MMLGAGSSSPRSVTGKIGVKEIERLIRSWKPTRRFLPIRTMTKRPPTEAALLSNQLVEHDKQCEANDHDGKKDE
jgi:hypothetical protein